MLGSNGHAEMNGAKCGKCLLTEFDGGRFAERIKEYISLIPEEEKTAAEEYRRRLDICRRCFALMDGLCGECGCFAEIRAAKRRMDCPVGKWSRDADS